MSTPREIHCYALRRLNPYLGVVQMLETPTGRASTSNGVVWHIELLFEKPRGWGSLNTDEGQKAWSLYGLWSDQDGLVGSDVAAQSWGQRGNRDAKVLIATLRAHLVRVPFPLADSRELWLLDEAQKEPLALLFAMPPEAKRPSPEPSYWSGCLGRNGSAAQRRFPEIERLESQVRKRAGFNINRLWVTWDTARQFALTDDGKPMERDKFPAYGVREEWPEKDAQALVQRYIDWTAPSLLTLPYLDDQRRSALESRLVKQARSIEYHWRLYPTVLDRNKLAAARVQGKLQSSVNADQ